MLKMAHMVGEMSQSNIVYKTLHSSQSHNIFKNTKKNDLFKGKAITAPEII